MSLVDSFTHLKGHPKSEAALSLLQRIASLVKPVMRKHVWKLPVLAEFFPDNPSLLGLNMNNGQKILLRLRPSWAPDTFYDEDQLVSSMLHELTHNIHGPHDDKFYNFLSNPETEYEVLRRTGYDGEGFLSAGKRLGVGVSHNVPRHSVRAKALQSAGKRRALQQMMSPGGQRLGGTPPKDSNSMSPRELAAQAAERRAQDEKACGTSRGSDAQREAEKASRDSCEDRAKTLEDASNMAGSRSTENTLNCIASGSNHFGNERLSNKAGWSCAICTLDNIPDASQCLACLSARPIGSSGLPRRSGNPPHGTLSSVSSTSTTSSDLRLAVSALDSRFGKEQRFDAGWACPACTLVNLDHFLQCSLCSTVRPKNVPEDGWTCMTCGEDGIPHDFWSCCSCGCIKESSV